MCVRNVNYRCKNQIICAASKKSRKDYLRNGTETQTPNISIAVKLSLFLSFFSSVLVVVCVLFINREEFLYFLVIKIN